MLLDEGDCLLICHRRQFAKEEPRYFLGKVSSYEQGIAKVTGYTFVRDMTSGDVLRKRDLRTKIIPLSSSAIIIYELPRKTDISRAHFVNTDGDLSLQDGTTLNMNMAEYAHAGHI